MKKIFIILVWVIIIGVATDVRGFTAPLNYLLINSSEYKSSDMKEIWKDVLNYEGYYQVSNSGKIKSIDREVRCKSGFRKHVGKYIKQNDNTHGYLIVGLCKNGLVSTKKVHRIVAEAFIGKIDNKLQVNHINGIKTDNRAINLELCSHGENQRHSFMYLGRKGGMSGKCGYDNNTSKAVVKMTMSGNYICEYGSQSEASRKTGISQTTISRCCRNISTQTGGYKWKYKHNGG